MVGIQPALLRETMVEKGFGKVMNVEDRRQSGNGFRYKTDWV
jgi:hypothetical protein